MGKLPVCESCGAKTGSLAHPTLVCLVGKPTVEKIAQPELAAPAVQGNAQGTVQTNAAGTVQVHGGTVSTVTYPPSTVTSEDGTVTAVGMRTVTEIRVPKNRAWESRNSERYRAWRKEYDRNRRLR